MLLLTAARPESSEIDPGDFCASIPHGSLTDHPQGCGEVQGFGVGGVKEDHGSL